MIESRLPNLLQVIQAVGFETRPPYLLQVRYGLLEGPGQLESLLAGRVLLPLVQQADDVGYLGVLVHVERQVVQGRDGFTLTVVRGPKLILKLSLTLFGTRKQPIQY